MLTDTKMNMRRENTKSQLLQFFILAFAIAWVVWIPIYLKFIPETSVPLGFLGPIASATILTIRDSGKKGLKELYGGLIRFKAKPKWFFALFTPAIIVTLTHLIFSMMFGFDSFLGIDKIIVNYVIITLFLILEEIGWRGYALPRLLTSKTALASSIILGSIWAVWHFPFWTIVPIDGAPEPFYVFYLTGTLGAIAMAVIITWIYNNTKQSIAMAAMCHASFNATIGAITFDKTIAIYHNLIFVLLATLTTILLVLLFGSKTLSSNTSL